MIFRLISDLLSQIAIIFIHINLMQSENFLGEMGLNSGVFDNGAEPWNGVINFIEFIGIFLQ
jgi:hypothetical protein